jgi:hypothetical protein
MSAKLVPTFADRGCHVVNTIDPHGCTLGFLNRSRYYFFQVAPQLYSRGWVDPVPDPPLLRNSGNARKRTRDLWICSQELCLCTKTVIILSGEPNKPIVIQWNWWPLQHSWDSQATPSPQYTHMLSWFCNTRIVTWHSICTDSLISTEPSHYHNR